MPLLLATCTVQSVQSTDEADIGRDPAALVNLLWKIDFVISQI